MADEGKLEAPRGGFIYFIRAGDAGPLKVGFSVNVRRRLSTLQMGCPCELHLLHHEPGTLADEASWHERLQAFHVRGEWYRPNHIIHRHLKAVGLRMTPYRALSYERSARQFSNPYLLLIQERREKNGASHA